MISRTCIDKKAKCVWVFFEWFKSFTKTLPIWYYITSITVFSMYVDY